jgi:hypothetical protein
MFGCWPLLSCGPEGNQMTTIAVNPSAKAGTSRASQLAAMLYGAVGTWFRRTSQARAEGRALADRASEAAEVRTYAQQVMHYDPRFAADLFAAADRHELNK